MNVIDVFGDEIIERIEIEDVIRTFMKESLKEKHHIVHFLNHCLGIQNIISFHSEKPNFIARIKSSYMDWVESLKKCIHSTNFLIIFPDEQAIVQISNHLAQQSDIIQTYISGNFKENKSYIISHMRYGYTMNGENKTVITPSPKILVCKFTFDEFLVPYSWLPIKWGFSKDLPYLSLRKVKELIDFYKNPHEYEKIPELVD